MALLDKWLNKQIDSFTTLFTTASDFDILSQNSVDIESQNGIRIEIPTPHDCGPLSVSSLGDSPHHPNSQFSEVLSSNLTVYETSPTSHDDGEQHIHAHTRHKHKRKKIIDLRSQTEGLSQMVTARIIREDVNSTVIVFSQGLCNLPSIIILLFSALQCSMMYSIIYIHFNNRGHFEGFTRNYANIFSVPILSAITVYISAKRLSFESLAIFGYLHELINGNKVKYRPTFAIIMLIDVTISGGYVCTVLAVATTAIEIPELIRACFTVVFIFEFELRLINYMMLKVDDSLKYNLYAYFEQRDEEYKNSGKIIKWSRLWVMLVMFPIVYTLMSYKIGSGGDHYLDYNL